MFISDIENRQNMKILYPFPMKLSNGYTYMLSILQFLNVLSLKFDVTLCSLDTNEEIDEYFTKVLGEKKNKEFKIRTLSNKFLGVKSNKFVFFYNLKKIIKRIEDPLIIYSRDLKQMRLAIKSFKGSRNRYFVFETHQILSENYQRKNDYKNAKILRRLESFVFENTNLLISITETLREDIDKKFHAVTQNHYVLPLGFNKRFLDIKLSKTPKYHLIYAGNFSPWKGLDVLIHAVKILKSDYREKLKVLLVGATPDSKKIYTQLINSLQLNDVIEISMRVKHKDIYKYLKNAEIGIIPNKYEGDGMLYTNPLKLYEYLAVGLKVVASELPSILSAVPKNLIFFYKPEDTKDLARKIKLALECKRTNIKEKRNFSTNFTWESRVEKFCNVLNENINNKI
jgi:glycosyltransferase involved in cell wall biosynthesis